MSVIKEKKLTKSTFESWINVLRSNSQAKLRLFCFPHAGGWSANFRNWSNNLPNEVEVCSVELPGRGTRFLELPFNRLVPLVEELSEAIVTGLDRPFAFFGHSMGGLVAFEVARLLGDRYNIEPVHFFIFASPAPHLPRTKTPIHNLSDSEFIEQLRCYNGTPGEILNNPELRELFLPALRSDFEVIETYLYRPHSPFNFPIDVFGGLEDTSIDRKQLEAWRDRTTGDFTIETISGSHFLSGSSELLLLAKISQKLLINLL